MISPSQVVCFHRHVSYCRWRPRWVLVFMLSVLVFRFSVFFSSGRSSLFSTYFAISSFRFLPAWWLLLLTIALHFESVIIVSVWPYPFFSFLVLLYSLIFSISIRHHLYFSQNSTSFLLWSKSFFLALRCALVVTDLCTTFSVEFVFSLGVCVLLILYTTLCISVLRFRPVFDRALLTTPSSLAPARLTPSGCLQMSLSHWPIHTSFYVHSFRSGSSFFSSLLFLFSNFSHSHRRTHQFVHFFCLCSSFTFSDL